MSSIVLDEKNVLKYIKESLNSFKKDILIIENARYHHNASYDNASSIIKNGILSLSELDRLNIMKNSSKILNIMNDIESHVNGNDGISLSVVGLTDLYKDEDEYNPFRSSMVDFVISSKVSAFRRSEHYGNEFIASKCIEKHFIKSIDVRILNYLNQTKKEYIIEGAIKKYNFLREIAIAIKKYDLDIPIREMSDNNEIELDVDKLIDTPRLVLKRY